MRRLDPRIHAEIAARQSLTVECGQAQCEPNIGMGCRIKSGNDEEERAAARVFGRPGLHSS
jgi:hypothetical protein